MVEYFHNPFNHFDPIKGKVPKYFSYQFEYIARNARNILKGRTRKQIDYGVKTINWIMEMADWESTENKLFDEIVNNLSITNKKAKGKANNKKPELNNDYYSPASMLLNSIGNYDISDQTDLPNAIYSEYFAILALAIIEVVCKEEKELDNLQPLNHLAFNSMEAISYANLLASSKLDELTKIFATKQLRKKISSAALKGHEKRRKIKIKFIEFYKKGEFKKKNRAVKEFIKTLTDEEKKQFVDTNIENVLLKALREYEKGKFKCNSSDFIY